MKSGKLFIVSAPSGAGKTSLVHAALEHFNDAYAIERAITYTSKTARPGEKHGEDYYFVTQEEFQVMIQEGFFLEYSTAYGNYYGTPGYIVEGMVAGTSYILVIDRAGAKQILKKVSRCILIWIDIPDIETLSKRLIARKTETQQQLKKRLLIAQEELLEEKREKLYQYHICNDVFEKALIELVSTIRGSLESAQECDKVEKI